MYNLISGAEDREMEIEERAEQDAKANLTIISNIMQESGNGYDSLTEEQVLQINSLETQAGLPVGLFQFTLDKDPESKIQTVTSRTDNAGNTYFDVLKVGPDGEMTVDSIFKGKAKVATSGGSTYRGPSSYQEWTLAGGLEGTGQTYAEYLKKDGDTTDSDRSSVEEDVARITGADNKVNPVSMNELRQDIALNNPELLSWFDNAFLPKDLLDPDRYSYEIGEGVWVL